MQAVVEYPEIYRYSLINVFEVSERVPVVESLALEVPSFMDVDEQHLHLYLIPLYARSLLPLNFAAEDARPRVAQQRPQRC